jgi:hypothetical protein
MPKKATENPEPVAPPAPPAPEPPKPMLVAPDNRLHIVDGNWLPTGQVFSAPYGELAPYRFTDPKDPSIAYERVSVGVYRRVD